MKKFIIMIMQMLTHFIHGAEDFMKNHMHPAINVIEVIKKIVDNPAIDAIASLLTAGVSDTLHPIIDAALTKAIETLEIAVTFSEGATLDDKLKAVGAFIATVPSKHMRDAIYAKLAQLIAKFTDEGGMLTDSEIAMLSEIGYNHQGATAALPASN